MIRRDEFEIEYVNPYKYIWYSVILQAFADISGEGKGEEHVRNRRKSIDFVNNDKSLKRVCDFIEVDSKHIKNKAYELINNNRTIKNGKR
jgi:hypothetical protein